MSKSANTHIRADEDTTLLPPTPPEKREISSRAFSEEILASDLFQKLPEDIEKEMNTLSEGNFSVEQIHKKLASVIVQTLANAAEAQGVVSPASLKGIKVFSGKLSKSENAKLYTSKLVSAKITSEEYLDALLGQFDKKATTEEIANITRKGVADKLSSYGQKIKVEKPIEKRTGQLGPNTVINGLEGATTAGLSGAGLANILGTSQLSGSLLAGAMGLGGAAMATATIQSLGKSLEKYRNGTLKTWKDKTKAVGLPVAFALATGFAGYGIQKGDEAGTIGATAYTAAANAKMLEVVNSDQYKKLVTTLQKGGKSNSQAVQTALEEFLTQEEAKGGKGPAWEAKNLLISGSESNNDTKQIDSKPAIRSGLQTAQNTLSGTLTTQEQKIKSENPQFYIHLKSKLNTESLSSYAQKYGYKGTITLMQSAINSYLQAEATALKAKQEALKKSTPKTIDKSTLSIYDFNLHLEDWKKATKDIFHPSDIGGMSYTGAIEYGSQLKTDLDKINANITNANQALSEIANANVKALKIVTDASNQAYTSRTKLNIDPTKVTAKITPPDTQSISNSINTNIHIDTIEESKRLIKDNFGEDSLETVEVFATNRGAIIAYSLLALGGIAGLIGTLRRERKLKGKHQSEEFKQSIGNALNIVIDQIHFGINKELMPLSSVSHEFVARPVVESAVWSMMIEEHSEIRAFAPAHIQSQLDNLSSAAQEVKEALKNIFADIHITPGEKPKKSRLKTFGRYIGNALIGDKRNDIEKKYADAYAAIESIDTQEALNKVLKGFAHTFDEGTPASEALEKIAAIGDTAERAIYGVTDPSLQDEMRLQNNIHSHNLYTEIENHPSRMSETLEAEYDAAKKKVFEAFTDSEKFAVLLSLEPEEIKLYTSMALNKIADHYQSEKERLHAFSKKSEPSKAPVPKKSKSWRQKLNIFRKKDAQEIEPTMDTIEKFEIQVFPAIETIDKRLAGDDFATIERFLGYSDDDFRTSQEIANLIRGDAAKANEILNKAGIKGPNRKKIFEGFKTLGEAYDSFSEAKAIQGDIQTNYASADHMTINRKTRNLKELIIKTMKLLDDGHEMKQYAEEVEAIRKAQFVDNYRDLFALDTDGSSQILQQILKTGEAPENMSPEDLKQAVRSEILSAKRQKQVATETENIATKYSNIISSEELKEKILSVLSSSADIAETTKDLRAALDSQESLLAAIEKNDLTEFARLPDDIFSKVTPETQEAIIQSAQTTKSNKLRQEVINQNADKLKEVFGDMMTEEDFKRMKLMLQLGQRDYDGMHTYLSNHRKLRDAITDEDLGQWVNTPENILSALKEEDSDNILSEARTKKARFESINHYSTQLGADFADLLKESDGEEIKSILTAQKDLEAAYESIRTNLTNHQKLRSAIAKEDLDKWVLIPENVFSVLTEEGMDHILGEARAKKVRFESILAPISRAAEDLGYSLTPADLTAIDDIDGSDERDLFIDTLRFQQALSQSKEKLIADGFSSEFANAHVSLEDESDTTKIIADALQKGALATAKALNIPLDAKQTTKIASKNDYEEALISAISTELAKMDNVTGTSVPRISNKDLGENIEHLRSIREMAILINQINDFEGLSKIEGWNGLNKKTLENILDQRLSQERAAMMTPELTNIMEAIDNAQDSFDLNKQQLDLIRNSIIANYIRAHEGIEPGVEEQLAQEYLQKKTEKAMQQWKADLKSYDFIAGGMKAVLDAEITTPEAIAAIRWRLDAYKKQYTKHGVAFDTKARSLSDDDFDNLMKMVESKPDIWKFGAQAQISARDLITLHNKAGNKIQVAIDRLANLADHANNLALPEDSKLLIDGLLDKNERTYQSWVK